MYSFNTLDYSGMKIRVGNDVFIYEKGELIKESNPKTMNTVPFDYSLIAKGYKVQTRGGIDVDRIHMFEDKETSQPLVAFVGSSVYPFSKKGEYYGDKRESSLDLVMIPPTEERYMVVSLWDSITYHEKVSDYHQSDYFQIKITKFAGEITEVELVK